MKIVKQEKLFYIIRNTHKVYEVDLCEVGDQEYIVNVRYGEQGGKMREGTKTVYPVSYDRALKTFNDLVDKKKEKGYETDTINAPQIIISNPSRTISTTSSQTSTTNTSNSTNTSSSQSGRGNMFQRLGSALTSNSNSKFREGSKEESILKRLESAVEGNVSQSWKLSRVIWKVGELKITKANSLILQLAKNNDALFQYSVAWTLGRLKQGTASIDVLMDYYGNGEDKVKRIAGEALLENLPQEEIENAVDSIIPSLPTRLKEVIDQEENKIVKEIQTLLQGDYKNKSADFLYTLYIVSRTKPHVRKGLLLALKNIEYKRNLFKPVRHIFKMAEFREDAEMFALLGHKMYKQSSRFHSTQHNRRTIAHNHSFSQYTKEYFHRRILRTLENCVESNTETYINFAIELLLAYNDEKELDKTDLAFHYLIHGGSDNWVLERSLSGYYWYNTSSQNNTIFSLRHDRLESNPTLWDDQQESTIRLITQSTQEKVLEFATKVYYHNKSWYDKTNMAFVLTLLAKDSRATRMLGIDIAKTIYDPSNPDINLLLALLQTAYLPAQELALTWIQADPRKFLMHWDIIHYLLISPSEIIHNWVIQNLPLYAKLIPTEALEKALAKTIFLLYDVEALKKNATSYWNAVDDQVLNNQYIAPIVKNLIGCFSEKLYEISKEVVIQLLNSSLEKIQHFGATILVNHKLLSKDLSKELLTNLLTSPFQSVREEASKLLNKFDAKMLYNYRSILWEQSIHGAADIQLYLVGICEYISLEISSYRQEFLIFLLQNARNVEQVRFCTQHYLSQDHFKNLLMLVPIASLGHWVASKEEEIQLLAFEILLRHQDIPAKLPSEYLERGINSEYINVRNKGLELLSKLETEDLLKQQEVIVEFCMSSETELQEGISAILQKLVPIESFSVFATDQFSRTLLRKETYEGIHDHVYALLTTHFSKQFHHISEKRMWKLIRTNHQVGNMLGARLLKAYDLSKVTVRTLVGLGSHEVLVIRQVIWDYFTEAVDRIRYEAEQAVRLLDASWDDSRAFAFTYFENNFDKEHWTPELLISICDSVREDVQQYGRKLITKFFEDKEGEIYLLRLSQHPTKEVQLLVTNYVERFANNKAENMEKLIPYFTTVLMNVNKGRVAKQRILTFLHQQSIAEEKNAALLLPMFTQLSLTVSIELKAKIIQILRDIQLAYPHLGNPIKVKEVNTI